MKNEHDPFELRMITDLPRQLERAVGQFDAAAVATAAMTRDRPPVLRFIGMTAATAGVVALAVVVTVSVLTVVGALGERGPSLGSDDAQADVGIPIEGLEVDPRPTDIPDLAVPASGPVVDVARGRVEGVPFRFIVYRAAPPNDVCIYLELLPTSGGGCGSLPGEGPTGGAFGNGSMSHGSAVTHEVVGLVAPIAAEVWIETNGGGQAEARLIPLDAAGIDAQLFIAFLPGGVDSSSWVALDAGGNVIGRLATPPGPAEASGPPPTPAAAP